MPLPDENAPSSAYQFTDSSVTRPLLTRVWFTRLFPFVPRWLAANLVSLLACGSLLTVLALSLAPGGWSETAIALVFFAALQIYVADFGLSRVFEGDMGTYCGSPEYVAPEVLALGPYDQAVDLWSVGVITYILLTGFLPFYDKDHPTLFRRIQDVDYNWDDCPEVSAAAKHFVQHLLVKDTKKRLTAEQALNHPWIKGGAGLSVLKMRPSFHDLLGTYNSNRKSKSGNSPSASFEDHLPQLSLSDSPSPGASQRR